MIPVHREYTVEIKKLKFETDDGQRYPCTALLHFKVDGKEKPLVELMGHREEKNPLSSITAILRNSA
jgi:hypothetical protein